MLKRRERQIYGGHFWVIFHVWCFCEYVHMYIYVS